MKQIFALYFKINRKKKRIETLKAKQQILQQQEQNNQPNNHQINKEK